MEESSFKHFIHGAISGAVGVTMSHPFDTIKTCIQDKKPKPTNFKGLYRGFTSPLFGVGLEKSIVFGVYTNTKKAFEKNSLSVPIAGAVSGFCASFIVTPVEKIKILLQTGQQVKMNQLTPKYMFQGLSATFTRETLGFAIYFSFYESMKRKLYQNNITTLGSFVLGGLSGSLAWCFIYPQDCIKTRMQAHSKNNKFLKVVKDIYTEGGLGRFYKGFGFALMRAVPLHAGTFMTMEMLKKYES